MVQKIFSIDVASFLRLAHIKYSKRKTTQNTEGGNPCNRKLYKAIKDFGSLD